MSTLVISKFEQWVTDVASEYRQKGYEVTIHPSDEQLPDFLRPFGPDLIAISPIEKVAVRVQASGRVQRTELLTELAKAIDTHPGWRFDLVIDRQPDKQAPGLDDPRIDKPMVRQRLLEGEQLAVQGMLDAALLIIWSALEAACWWAFQKDGLSLTRHTPAAYVSRLYTEGFVDESDYRHLTKILDLRNAVAHGVQGATIHKSDIQTMLRITRRLIGKKD